MTDKDLRRLKRVDLLRMLMEESKESTRMQESLETKNEEIIRLNGRIDEMQKQIVELEKALVAGSAAAGEKETKFKLATDAMSQMVAENSTHINRLMARLQEKEEAVKKMQAKLDEKERQNWELANTMIGRMAI